MPTQLTGQTLPLCTGREKLTKYGQEGLVPFVGEKLAFMEEAYK